MAISVNKSFWRHRRSPGSRVCESCALAGVDGRSLMAFKIRPTSKTISDPSMRYGCTASTSKVAANTGVTADRPMRTPAAKGPARFKVCLRLLIVISCLHDHDANVGARSAVENRSFADFDVRHGPTPRRWGHADQALVAPPGARDSRR